MRIILLNDVAKLGKKNTIVEVKKGFFYNVLLPQKKAVAASEKNIAILKRKLVLLEKKQIELEKRMMQVKEKLEKIELVFSMHFHKGKGKGTITSKMIVDKIKDELKMDFDKKDLQIEHISKPGSYIANLHLVGKINAAIRIVVNEDK